jgi:hypothetical protein
MLYWQVVAATWTLVSISAILSGCSASESPGAAASGGQRGEDQALSAFEGAWLVQRSVDSSQLRGPLAEAEHFEVRLGGPDGSRHDGARTLEFAQDFAAASPAVLTLHIVETGENELTGVGVVSQVSWLRLQAVHADCDLLVPRNYLAVLHRRYCVSEDGRELVAEQLSVALDVSSVKPADGFSVDGQEGSLAYSELPQLVGAR